MQLWNSQNTPKNASESVSYLPEIRFRSPPGPPTRALPWTHWGPRRPPDPLPVVLPHCSGPSYAPDRIAKRQHNGKRTNINTEVNIKYCMTLNKQSQGQGHM